MISRNIIVLFAFLHLVSSITKVIPEMDRASTMKMAKKHRLDDETLLQIGPTFRRKKLHRLIRY